MGTGGKYWQDVSEISGFCLLVPNDAERHALFLFIVPNDAKRRTLFRCIDLRVDLLFVQFILVQPVFVQPVFVQSISSNPIRLG